MSDDIKPKKEGNLFRRALNRLQRRKFKNRAQVEGKPSKKYYTTKQTKTRKKKNGKKVQVRKTSSK